MNAAQAIVDLFIDEEFNHTSVMLRPPGPKASQEVNSCSTAMTLFHISHKIIVDSAPDWSRGGTHRPTSPSKRRTVM